MMKKTLSAVLAVSVLASMAVGLSGCGSKNAKGGVIKWVQLGDRPDAIDSVLAKANEIIEPELGLKLEIEFVDGASFDQKSKMKMASGEDFDLIFTGYVNNYQTAVSLGGLYDITELVDNIEMADGTKVKMSDVIEDYYMESAMVHGKLYGIPNIQVISNPVCIQMEKEIAEECGVDLEALQEAALNNTNLETAKKYMDLLTGELAKIKEKRPDLYTVSPFNVAPTNIYEDIVGGVGFRRDGSSDKLVKTLECDERICGIDTVRSWYEKGYIRNDIASVGSTATSNEDARRIAVSVTTWKPGQEIYFMNERDGAEPAYAFCAEPYVSRTSALLTMISVGANSKHPEEAVKLIYMLNSNKELFNILCWGIEGVNYTLNEDGTATEISGTGYDKMAQNAWRFGNQFNGHVMEGQPATVWEETAAMNDNAVKSPAIGFVPDTDPITTELANITNINSEYKARIEYGTSPRSEYWDEYVKKLYDAGYDKVYNELQKQYDEFIASKNK